MEENKKENKASGKYFVYNIGEKHYVKYEGSEHEKEISKGEYLVLKESKDKEFKRNK